MVPGISLLLHKAYCWPAKQSSKLLYNIISALLSSATNILINQLVGNVKKKNNITKWKGGKLKLTCTLTKTLEALDEKLRMLKQNLNDMNRQVQDCKADMKEVKRLIKDLHQRNGLK